MIRFVIGIFCAAILAYAFYGTLVVFAPAVFPLVGVVVGAAFLGALAGFAVPLRRVPDRWLGQTARSELRRHAIHTTAFALVVLGSALIVFPLVVAAPSSSAPIASDGSGSAFNVLISRDLSAQVSSAAVIVALVAVGVTIALAAFLEAIHRRSGANRERLRVVR